MSGSPTTNRHRAFPQRTSKRTVTIRANTTVVQETNTGELANKLKRPLHPSGRDVRCIVSVGMLTEGWDYNIATVFGVPFEVIPFKQSKHGSAPRPKRNHVQAIPEKAEFEITFPRVEGYRQAIRNKVTVDLDLLASLTIDPKLAEAAA